MQQIALSSIIGAPVYDNSGELAGHVREVAISDTDAVDSAVKAALGSK